MLKYILSVFVIALIWSAWWVLEWPVWIPIVVTSVIVVGLTTYVIIKEIRARRASREIEKALKAQAEREARSVRPDRQADIVALQGEFDQAISSLKSSRIGSRGAAVALYELPWYVIIGRPGAGKSTALRRSGLSFPFRSSRGDVSVRGVGGTRNCEWWMTREAVILDTAGRYTSEDADRDEWLAFLDLLKRFRARRPINGILATVSATELAAGSPQDASALAREVRGRVDELQDRLGVAAPVYVVVTKCDLLPGFLEMFGDLTDEDRGQIWGFTLPAKSQTNLSGQTTRHFDELVSILEQRTLRRLVEEPRMEKREKIYAFPQHFAAVRDSLSRFVHELTIEDAFHETPIIRGVYWSSGTQEGTPRDAIMSTVASAFGFRPSTESNAPVPATEAKSYFLGDLFHRVIFPDHNLAGRSAERTRKQKRWVNAIGAVGLLLTVALIWLPLVSFKENRDLIAEAELGVDYVQQHVEEDTVEAIRLERLNTLRLLLDTLAQYRDDGEPWSMTMGMYQGDTIYPHLRDVYAATVRNELLMPLVERDLAAMEKFATLYGVSGEAPPDEEYDDYFDRLRLYLLVTGPSVEGEPGLTAEERSWVVGYLADRWTKPLRDSGDPATMTAMGEIATTYVDILADQPALAYERDATLSERVQRILNRSDRTKSVTRALVDSVQGRSLTLRDMVGVPSIKNGDKRIRPAFTRQGYEGTIKPKLEEGLDEFLKAQWVLGQYDEQAETLRVEELDAIQTEYYRQYIVEWSTFIQEIYTETPEDYIGALNLLSQLTRAEHYKDLFSHISYHTQLVDLDALDSELGGPQDDRMLTEAARIAERRTRQKLRINRIANPRLTRMAADRAIDQAMAGAGAAGESLVLTDVDVTYAFLGLAEFGARKALPAPTVEGAPPPPPESVPIDDYQAQLSVLRTALQQRMDDPAEKEALVADAKAAQTEVRDLLDATEASGWKPTLERILLPPVDLVWNLTEKGVADDVASKWCSEVHSEFETKLSTRYPFKRSGADVPLADFASFFHPENGRVWQFYDAVLKNAVPLRGSEYELAKSGSRTLGRFKPNVARYLNAAQEVTTSAFAADMEVRVDFDVLIEGAPSVREVVLTIDGEEVRHRNGPEEWSSMTWPGKGNQGAKIEATGFGVDADLEREGEWGLFRLIEEGSVRVSPDRRTFAVQWDFRDEGAGLIQVRFRPRSSDSPFFGPNGSREFLEVFRTKRLRVPTSIMVEGSGCGRSK
ncbi:MAG: type VI secretion system membrane subunit TssM [Myxococcales bacterium]|nr:type VI secretion system membrane subunit TssM [Myxococcales bacterium]MCB9717393.1 type VI secretion system membrane subunit TssM [Myxococcales bacterium]